MGELTHFNKQGRARMVDVTEKAVTHRRAVAAGEIHVSPETMVHIKNGTMKKGDVLAVAQVAGIQAAKHNWELIPMWRPSPFTICARRCRRIWRSPTSACWKNPAARAETISERTDRTMAKVVSVNISEKKGTLKRAVPEIELKLRHGIVGDAHAGDWHRQISLLAEESIDTMRPRSPIALDPGIFAENINTEGIDLKGLPVGTHLRIGETEVEVTQIGKECHNDCAIKKAVGKCVMPTEGIFAVVVKEGVVRPGDEIEVLK